MGSPAEGKAISGWTAAAYVLVGIGIPIGWIITIGLALLGDRRAARRAADPRIAATNAALSDMFTRHMFPWRQDPQSVAAVNLETSTAAEELVEMQRAQNAWVPEPRPMSNAQLHREKVRQKLAKQDGARAGPDPPTFVPDWTQQHHRHTSRDSDLHGSHGRRRQYQHHQPPDRGGGGYESDGSSVYSTDTTRPSAPSAAPPDATAARPAAQPGAMPDAGPPATNGSHGSSRERTHATRGGLPRTPSPPTPPPQPKSSFPDARRDWRPQGDPVCLR